MNSDDDDLVNAKDDHHHRHQQLGACNQALYLIDKLNPIEYICTYIHTYMASKFYCFQSIIELKTDKLQESSFSSIPDHESPQITWINPPSHSTPVQGDLIEQSWAQFQCPLEACLPCKSIVQLSMAEYSVTLYPIDQPEALKSFHRPTAPSSAHDHEYFNSRVTMPLTLTCQAICLHLPGS